MNKQDFRIEFLSANFSRRRGRRLEQMFFLFTVITVLIAILGACAPATPTTGAELATPGPITSQDVQRVSLEESKSAFDSGTAVFVDVRPAESYAASHISGAISIPLAEIETRLTELDPEQWIITYCT